MELKELKCKNCGAKIELEEGKTEVKCKYCSDGRNKIWF